MTLGPGCEKQLATLDEELQRKLAEVDDQFDCIQEANKLVCCYTNIFTL
jgi:hypothetical protein